ncbi:unnamed protein product [Lactuca virosa]|uniref:Uncharacterized protein n=1 Tax=Lactuca virosa TaxID=75947 RepID=A0AAU9N7H9_9ASTR|nr:unnamed protein product [Lactuca virosa]
MVENGSGTDTAARSTVLHAKPVTTGFFSGWWRRRQTEPTTVANNDDHSWEIKNLGFTFVGEEIEQRGVMPEELCCRRGKERRKRGERAGEGTSNEGWFWVAFTEDEGGKTEARSVGVDR